MASWQCGKCRKFFMSSQQLFHHVEHAARLCKERGANEK